MIDDRPRSRSPPSESEEVDANRLRDLRYFINKLIVSFTKETRASEHREVRESLQNYVRSEVIGLGLPDNRQPAEGWMEANDEEDNDEVDELVQEPGF